MKIEEVVKAIRIAKGIKQQAIADSLGIDQVIVSNIECGKREIKANELCAIANALGVSVVDLVSYPDKYVRADVATAPQETVKAVLQIELSKEKKDQVFRFIFGDNNLKILNS